MERKKEIRKRYKKMELLPKDPVLLLSVVNTKLRDFYESPEALCEDMNVRMEDLAGALQKIDYEYDRKTNQFI